MRFRIGYGKPPAVVKHYFDVTFNDAIGEIAGNDERYAELQSVADEAVHTLAGIVGESNAAIWEQCEHTINSLYTLQLQLVTDRWLFFLERM